MIIQIPINKRPIAETPINVRIPPTRPNVPFSVPLKLIIAKIPKMTPKTSATISDVEAAVIAVRSSSEGAASAPMRIAPETITQIPYRIANTPAAVAGPLLNFLLRPKKPIPWMIRKIPPTIAVYGMAKINVSAVSGAASMNREPNDHMKPSIPARMPPIPPTVSMVFSSINHTTITYANFKKDIKNSMYILTSFTFNGFVH